MEKAYSCSEAFSDGTRIYSYNRDETATTTVQKPKKGLSSKRTKQVSQSISGERGVLITTCCIMSAIGSAPPPVLMFPRKKNQKPHVKWGTSGYVGSGINFRLNEWRAISIGNEAYFLKKIRQFWYLITMRVTSPLKHSKKQKKMEL
jgi:hypothetical protein